VNTFRRIAACIAALLAFPAVGLAEKISVEILPTTEVSTSGGAVTVNYDSGLQEFDAGYVVIKTTNETATASLVVTIFGVNDNDAYLICSSTPAITDEETFVILLGNFQGPGGGVDQVCEFPIPRKVRFVFTVTGGGADFDVRAYLDTITAPT